MGEILIDDEIEDRIENYVSTSDFDNVTEFINHYLSELDYYLSEQPGNAQKTERREVEDRLQALGYLNDK
jgi:hypothetical protein